MADTSGKAQEAQGTVDDDPIMRQLRQVYDNVAQEPLPENLLDLLAKLDEAERKR